jgi:1-deoxy-D-xylulose-5-phosphate reductoisomerase
MRKKLFILGATGTIGDSTLDVIRQFPHLFEVVGIAANTSHEKLEAIASEFRPRYVHLMCESTAKDNASHFSDYHFIHGMKALCDAIVEAETDLLVAAMVGNIGLLPVITALENSISVALANKETLVSAGHIVTTLLKKSPQCELLPIDSEHSAIFQCLNGESRSQMSRILLTASGGSFRTWSREQMESITPAQALKHPNWDMGAKITIDSSTMMNKGLEVIEAQWLFNASLDQIQVVIHPQSIIHSMVEFIDGSVIAQLGEPDMRLPIQYALHYPKRLPHMHAPAFNPAKTGTLSFEEPDLSRFPCLKIAFEAGRQGGSCPAVMNAANEIAVQSFLDHKISFLQIPEVIQRVLDQHDHEPSPSLESILHWDSRARCEASSICKGLQL